MESTYLMMIIVLFNMLMVECTPQSLTQSIPSTTEKDCCGDDNPIPPPGG